MSCQANRTCNPASGLCSAPTPLANGTLCTNGSCLAGVCTGEAGFASLGLRENARPGPPVPRAVTAQPPHLDPSPFARALIRPPILLHSHPACPPTQQTSAPPATCRARPRAARRTAPATRPAACAALLRRWPMAPCAPTARAWQASARVGFEGGGRAGAHLPQAGSPAPAKRKCLLLHALPKAGLCLTRTHALAQISAPPTASSAWPLSAMPRGPAAPPRGPAALPRRSRLARYAQAVLARAAPASVRGEG
jgi:hypothetical protein